MNHKYRVGRRVLNWRVLVLSATILWCAVVGSHSNDDNTYVREPDVFMKPVVVENIEDESVETKIRKYFPKSHKTIIAIAHAESNMQEDVIGYNCYYYKGKATTTPIKGGSKACKPSDRHLAWSYDCGLLQLHSGKQGCKEETIDEHLQRAADLSRKQGLDAWVTYWNGSYKKYLAQN